MVKANNPILQGFYPDPSICRVGKDFYIATSSFVYAPGVPIFHSRDLAHWEQIGNILDREEQLVVDDAEISDGIYAPTIRYHKGTYYMITTNVTYGGNFVVTAQNPKGPWSKPYYLGDDAPGIDPSLFFDDDDRCYYVGTRPNPEGVRYNGDWEIWVQELDLDTMKLVGPSMAIWKGAVKDVIWPEGPHIYKKDGYYYLLHAEGGTGPEHSISVARSKELFQWFEGCKRNPIFSHRNLGKDYPIIYAGHGDLVDDEEGNWYIVMLASRPCQKHCSMGRETFLAKVTWEDGWPVINPGVGKLTDEVEIPLEEFRFPTEISGQDHFEFCSEYLDERFLGISKRNKRIYSLTERKGYLRLYTCPETLESVGNSAYIGIRQKSYDFIVSTGIEFLPQNEKEAAGLVLYQNHKNHLRMEIVKEEGASTERKLQVTAFVQEKKELLAECAIVSSDVVELQLRASKQQAQVWMGQKGQLELVCDHIDLLPYTTEEAGGFVGCTVGMYATSNGAVVEKKNHADYRWFHYDNQ